MVKNFGWLLAIALALLTQQSQAITTDKVMVYFPIAHSVNDESRRNVRYDLEKKDGWKRFVTSEVEPVLKLGVRTIMIHNPGGYVLSEGHRRFRQFSIAQEAGFDFVNDFSAAFLPLHNRGIDVVAYLGSPDDIDALLDTNGKRDRNNLPDENDSWRKFDPAAMIEIRQMVLDETQPVRKAGCRLGMDAVTEQGIHSLSFWLATLEARAGRRPVVEMTAMKHHRHWWSGDFDQLILYRSFRPRHLEGASKTFLRDWPQLGEGDWYKGTTYIMFRSPMKFLGGELAGQEFTLHRDATPVVGWWNEIRQRDPTNKFVPVFPAVVLRQLIKQDVLKHLTD